MPVPSAIADRFIMGRFVMALEYIFRARMSRYFLDFMDQACIMLSIRGMTMKIPDGISRVEGITFLRNAEAVLAAAADEGPVGIQRYKDDIAVVVLSVADFRRLLTAAQKEDILGT